VIAEAVQITAGVVVASWAGRRANAHDGGTSWLDRLTVSLIGAAGILAVVGVPLSTLPVIINVRAEVVQHTPGVARLHMHGTKPVSRGMCDFQALDAYVQTPAGDLVEVPMTVESDVRPSNTRPPGRHDFGVWRLEYAPGLRPAAVLFVAYHRCAWWMPPTRTQQGPFALPAPQAVN
jgi:hypothetical protein